MCIEIQVFWDEELGTVMLMLFKLSHLHIHFWSAFLFFHILYTVNESDKL